MHPETRFRLAVLAIMTFVMIVAIYHRWQAASSGERISHREEGLLFATILRLIGLCLWLGTFAYLFNPDWMEWAQVPLLPWVRWLGVVPGVIGCALVVWTLTNLGKNLTDTVVTRSHATLVTSGPYAWVRHPFYVTFGFLMLSVTLLTSNWLIGVSGIVILILLVVRTAKEEQMLVARFGDAYRAYMARTGRFFPRRGS